MYSFVVILKINLWTKNTYTLIKKQKKSLSTQFVPTIHIQYLYMWNQNCGRSNAFNCNSPYPYQVRIKIFFINWANCVSNSKKIWIWLKVGQSLKVMWDANLYFCLFLYLCICNDISLSLSLFFLSLTVYVCVFKFINLYLSLSIIFFSFSLSLSLAFVLLNLFSLFKFDGRFSLERCLHFLQTHINK